MKILIFGDTHGDVESLLEVYEKSKDADVILFLGDLTYFGEGMELVDIIAKFPRKVVMMYGNHEHKEHMRVACEPHENLHFSDQEIISIDEYDIVTYGGGGFSHIDEGFEIFMEEVKKHIRDPKKTIILFHAPPYNTKLDIPFNDYHSGTLSFRETIETIQPLASFAGHIHECENKYDTIGETLIHNPGPKGTLLDLDELHKKRIKKEIKEFVRIKNIPKTKKIFGTKAKNKN
jgi:Icc-related predicted phosphoesterase